MGVIAIDTRRQSHIPQSGIAYSNMEAFHGIETHPQDSTRQ